jgi:signal transduction histidine kinase
MSDNSSEQTLVTSRHSSSMPHAFLTTIRISIIIVVILSILDIFGWIFNIDNLKCFIPHSEPMKLITALCFVLASAALLVLLENFPAIIRQFLPNVFATIICLISLFSVYTYFFYINTGHESSITTIPPFIFFLSPDKKMSLLTACNFILSGSILFLLSSNKEKASGIAHFLIIPVFLISYLNIVKYILDVSSLTALSNISLSLNTGIVFCVISTGFLFMRPDTWFLRMFISTNIAGIISRRLLPPLILLPLIIGWLRIKGERFGLVESESGVVVTTIIYSICFLMLVWLTARYINQVDRKRQASEEQLKKSYIRLGILSETASQLLITDDPQKLINDLCNKVMNFLDCQIFLNFLANESSGKLQLNAYSGIYAGAYQKIEWLNFEAEICGRVILDRKRIFAENIQGTRDPLTDHIRSLGINTYVCQPLFSKDAVFGTISFGSSSRITFFEDDLLLVQTIADHISVSLSRVKYEKDLYDSDIRLKELNDTKDKFFNIVAHDLKNPFTSMLGSSELLYDNISNLSLENIKDLAQILNDSAKGGYAILQNLLDWSRSQTGLIKFNPERINLRDLFNENISNLELSAANKEIKLFSENEKDIYILADKNMINTVLRNLLSNAVKFTPRSGTVIVSASITKHDVIISVKDTGVGISEEKLETLFRIDSRNSMPGTENEQGTGLGLKLSKEFAEKMGCKLWVESIEKKGSEFKFSIPIKKG